MTEKCMGCKDKDAEICLCSECYKKIIAIIAEECVKLCFDFASKCFAQYEAIMERIRSELKPKKE
ncbi:MAG: hypothetical protein DRJ60_00445 [Thermoprotei archaeon]|nr:MAG: hypothetical protein DRJ60_00445 [Thermoprotei archaeon]